jgi:hypothetical protein
MLCASTDELILARHRIIQSGSGVVLVGNESYSIARGHEIWYDPSTLGFNERPLNDSKRYHGHLASRPVVAFDTVVEGSEGKEFYAQMLFGGTLEEYLASQRQATAFMRIFGAIFGTVGLLLSAIGTLLILDWHAVDPSPLAYRLASSMSPASSRACELLCLWRRPLSK